MRNAILALMLVTLTATAAPAQDGWVIKMFKEGASHDFGNVPNGTQLFYQFKFTNIYAVRMEIVDIRPGCSCTKADATKRVLEPKETTTINVSMDTTKFAGNSKTVDVRISVLGRALPPDTSEFTSSGSLRVTAFSRRDIVFNPSEINFGAVNAGQTQEKTIDIDYAGKLDFKISEVVAKDLPLDVSLEEAKRLPGQVGYKVKAVLKGTAPAGLFRENIYLKTNDPASPLVPVLVEANVQTAVSLSSNRFDLGTVKSGDSVTRRVLIKGNKPFKVLSVEGSGDGIEADCPKTIADQQIVTFKCQVAKEGDFKRELKIKTDLQETPLVVTIEGKTAKKEE